MTYGLFNRPENEICTCYFGGRTSEDRISRCPVHGKKPIEEVDVVIGPSDPITPEEAAYFAGGVELSKAKVVGQAEEEFTIEVVPPRYPDGDYLIVQKTPGMERSLAKCPYPKYADHVAAALRKMGPL